MVNSDAKPILFINLSLLVILSIYKNLQFSSLNFASNSSNTSTECVDRKIPVYSVLEIFAIVSASTLTRLLQNSLLYLLFVYLQFINCRSQHACHHCLYYKQAASHDQQLSHHQFGRRRFHCRTRFDELLYSIYW